MGQYIKLKDNNRLTKYDTMTTVGGLVHLLKSTNLRYAMYNTMLKEDSTLIIYGLDRQNLIYKIVDEDTETDYGIVYESRYSRVRKTDYKIKKNLGYCLIVLIDNTTDSAFKQKLVLKTSKSVQEIQLDASDAIMMPEIEQKFELSHFNDLMLVNQNGTDLVIIQIDFAKIELNISTRTSLTFSKNQDKKNVETKGGILKFEPVILVNHQEQGLLKNGQEIFLITMISDNSKVQYLDLFQRKISQGYGLNFIGFFYDEHEIPIFLKVNTDELDGYLKEQNIQSVTYMKTRYDPS